jgi:hypothetical protein
MRFNAGPFLPDNLHTVIICPRSKFLRDPQIADSSELIAHV